jgi:Dolichyl-phosphate-mannose-protein mannosyltransferase
MQTRALTPANRDRALALALGAATFLTLWLTESTVGFPRDESFYFHAADQAAAWYVGLWHNLWSGQILTSFSDPVLTQAFQYNAEHPMLMKSLYGLSHWLFTTELGWLRPAAGYRLPAWIFSGVLSAILFLLGKETTGRRSTGILAVLAFWTTPRQLFHGYLACFDMPITVMWLLVVYCYRRGFESRRWVVLTGVAYGLALSTKHNAFFYPAAFLAHWAWSIAPGAYRQGRWSGLVRSFPRQWAAMATIGPALLLLHWPYVWPHPIDRLGFWIGFHLHHVNYPWAYLHQLLREPPFPLAYVAVVTALTVPLPLVVLMSGGIASSFFSMAQRRLDSNHVLILFNGLLPLVLLSIPSVPHFGGVKHWMPGMPFLCLLAAEGLEACAGSLTRHLTSREWRRRVSVGLAGLVLLPGVLGCVHIHGFGTSYYNELAGGGAGGAELGMERQFWSNNVSGVLDWINRNAPPHAHVYFHEVTYGSYQAYIQNGMLRPDIQWAQGAQDAQIVPYQYMLEFRDQEFEVWNNFGTAEPVSGLYLDEAPNVTVYTRP